MAKSNYNAGTAWNYLGTGLFDGRGAYDYSSLPGYLADFRKIYQNAEPKRPIYGEQDYYYDTIGRIGNNKYPGISINDVANIMPSIQTYPQVALKNTLAGRYTDFV